DWSGRVLDRSPLTEVGVSFTSSKNSNTFDALCLLKDLMPRFKGNRRQGVCASMGHLHNIKFTFTLATGCLCLRWAFT
ncbi:hypothetical protein Taro_029729, partial [Colocasia esculenta]|nr:hypothetical protein [Colocasia esculenta]